MMAEKREFFFFFARRRGEVGSAVRPGAAAATRL